MLCGDFASSRRHLEEVLAVYDPHSHGSLIRQAGDDPRVNSLAVSGIVLLCLGYPEEAKARSNAAIAEARSLAHPPSLASSLAFGTTVLSLVGDYEALDERAGQLVEIATEQGFPLWGVPGAGQRGWVMVRNGNVAEGISLMRSGLAAYHANGAVAWMPYIHLLLAGAHEITGQIEESLALLDEALQIIETTGARWLSAELNRHKGQILLRQGHSEAAEELYRRALNIAENQQAKLWELRAAMSLARLRLDQGRHPRARDLLATIYGWFTEGFDTPDLKEANILLQKLG
jgi:predicted ATPase